MTSLFVYIVKRYKSVFSSTSCHFPFGNHAKTDIFPHNILITFAADVQRSVLHIAFQARRSLSCFTPSFKVVNGKRIYDLMPEKITLVKYNGTVPADSTVETPDNSEDPGTSEEGGGGSLI